MNTTNTDDENIFEGALSEIADGSEDEHGILHALVACMLQNNLNSLSKTRLKNMKEFMKTKIRMSFDEAEEVMTIEILD